MQAAKLATPSSPLAFYETRGGAPGEAGWAKPSTATLVLGHALGSTHHMWDRVVPLLPPSARVVLWEQPGHGASDLLPVAEGGVSVGDIADALHAGLTDLGVLGASDPADLPVVAGLSLGGMVSLALAERYPAALSRLLMFSSGAVLAPSSAWVERAELVEAGGLASLADATMGRWFSDGFAEGAGEQWVEATRRAFLETGPAGYAQCCLAIAGTDLRADLAKVRVPVELVVGEDDPGMTPEQAVALAAALPGATVVVIEGAKHLTAVERPEEVAAILTDALS